MEKVSQKTTWPEYTLVYGLIAVSGVEYVYHSQAYTVLLFLAASLVAIIQKTIFTVRPLLIILVVFVLELLQAIQFGDFAPVSIVSVLLRLAVVYLIVHICGLKLAKWFVEIMYVITLISLPIYLLTFFPAVEQFLIERVARVFFNPLFSVDEGPLSPNILVYTFNPFAVDQVGTFLIKRNSGPFSGPGMFGVLINLALVLNTIRKKSLINKRNTWLIVALITTLSTTGFVTFFIIVLGSLFLNQTHGKPVRLTYFLLIIPVALLFYSQMAFMEDKIQQDIGLTQPDDKSRLNDAYLDLMDVVKSPLVGFGQSGHSQDRSMMRNNGVTSLLITYGIPATVLYFSVLFLFFRRYCQFYGFPALFAVFGFLSVLSSGFSQVIYDRAIVLAFLFLAERLRQVQSQELPVTRQRAHLTNSRA